MFEQQKLTIHIEIDGLQTEQLVLYSMNDVFKELDHFFQTYNIFDILIQKKIKERVIASLKKTQSTVSQTPIFKKSHDQSIYSKNKENLQTPICQKKAENKLEQDKINSIPQTNFKKPIDQKNAFMSKIKNLSKINSNLNLTSVKKNTGVQKSTNIGNIKSGNAFVPSLSSRSHFYRQKVQNSGFSNMKKFDKNNVNTVLSQKFGVLSEQNLLSHEIKTKNKEIMNNQTTRQIKVYDSTGRTEPSWTLREQNPKNEHFEKHKSHERVFQMEKAFMNNFSENQDRLMKTNYSKPEKFNTHNFESNVIPLNSIRSAVLEKGEKNEQNEEQLNFYAKNGKSINQFTLFDSRLNDCLGVRPVYGTLIQQNGLKIDEMTKPGIVLRHHEKGLSEDIPESRSFFSNACAKLNLDRIDVREVDKENKKDEMNSNHGDVFLYKVFQSFDGKNNGWLSESNLNLLGASSSILRGFRPVITHIFEMKNGLKVNFEMFLRLVQEYQIQI